MIFLLFNYAFLIAVAALCVMPMIHILAMSFSNRSAVAANFVKFLPIGFTTKAYEYVLGKREFLRAFLVSIMRVALGVVLTMGCTICAAYSLSKEANVFKARSVYVWLFVMTMLFHGGLIPTYMVVRSLGLLDTMWGLVLPIAIQPFYLVLLLNFFRRVPKEMSESAFIDGAGHWRILWNIIVPISIPAIATLTLFTTVFYWNEWFFGMIYSNSPRNYPLQSFLRTVIIDITMISVTSESDYELLELVSDRTQRAAQIFLAMIPIMIIYPFLQRYFITGIVLGSVKE